MGETRTSLVGRALAELEADPAARALRDRCAAATPGEIRALRGEWTAAVVRALWRGAAAESDSAPLGGETERPAGFRR